MKKPILTVKVFTLCVSVFGLAQAGDLALPQKPLQTSVFVKPNVMLLFDNSLSMRRGLGTSTRLKVAQKVASDVINNTDNVRFCLAIFNAPKRGEVKLSDGIKYPGKTRGGKVIIECADNNQQQVASRISQFTDQSMIFSTPLAATMYEIIEYFRNGRSVYNSGPVKSSPVQYRCQKNFTIVLTDGAAYWDNNFPNFKNKYGANVMGNYDRSSLSSDNYVRANIKRLELKKRKAQYEFLDDMAKLAYDTDFRSGTAVDLTGNSFDDPMFEQQNMNTYTIAFTLAANSRAAQMLKKTVDDTHGRGEAYSADNQNSLQIALQKTLSSIAQSSFSVSGAAGSGDSLVTGFRIFQARYTEDNWQGEVFGLAIDPATYQIDQSKSWSGPTIAPHSTRVIYSGFSGGSLFNDKNSSFSTLVGGSEAEGKKIINFIRGDKTTGFRTDKPAMGDVINSTPVYVGPVPKNIGYEVSDAIKTKYQTFYTQSKSRSMVFVGANDGMLHAIDADDGREIFSFVPTKVLSNLKYLTQHDNQHRFYVDGSALTQNVYIPAKGWRTVLVGGLGRGGQGIYVLDVTSDSFTNDSAGASKTYMWEFSDEDDADLGFSYSQPQIMRLNDGKFYVVLANGYNSTSAEEGDTNVSTTGEGVVFIIDLATGNLVEKLHTNTAVLNDPEGKGRANGIATVSGLDTDDDGKTDYLYAGDLFGNVWKWDLSAIAEGDVFSKQDESANIAAQKLFTAKYNKGATESMQSITNSLTVVKLPISNTNMLYFGTGKYLEAADTDSKNISTQTFYGIKDTTILNRGELLEQRITFEGEAGHNSIERLTSDKKIINHKGWFIDLQRPTYSHDNIIAGFKDDVIYEKSGEQVISHAVYRDSYNGRSHLGDGRIYFTTATSSNDPCLPNSTNYLMNLQASSGARFDYVSMDNDGSGKVDKNDGVITGDGQQVSTSGIKVSSSQAPIFVDVLDSSGRKTENELIIVNRGKVSGADDKFDVILSQKYALSAKRISWKEIRSK